VPQVVVSDTVAPEETGMARPLVNASEALPKTRPSYAQAAQARKRPLGATPAFPRPDLVRGEPTYKHQDYESMERPSPLTASPHLLYIDMRATILSAHDVLMAAFPVVGSSAIGFELFAAQRTLGLVFASTDARDAFVDKPVGDTGLSFHAAPTHRVELRKFTISDVPILAADVITAELKQAFEPYGDLVFLAPMVLRGTGWRSSTWHATIAVPPEKHDLLPPPTASLFGMTIILDVPGTRRYCRHCKACSEVVSRDVTAAPGRPIRWRMSII